MLSPFMLLHIITMYMNTIEYHYIIHYNIYYNTYYIILRRFVGRYQINSDTVYSHHLRDAQQPAGQVVRSPYRCRSVSALGSPSQWEIPAPSQLLDSKVLSQPGATLPAVGIPGW